MKPEVPKITIRCEYFNSMFSFYVKFFMLVKFFSLINIYLYYTNTTYFRCHNSLIERLEVNRILINLYNGNEINFTEL